MNGATGARATDGAMPHVLIRGRRPGRPGHPLRRKIAAMPVRYLSDVETERRPLRWHAISKQDVKEFLMAYCACFMAVMGLIA